MKDMAENSINKNSIKMSKSRIVRAQHKITNSPNSMGVSSGFTAFCCAALLVEDGVHILTQCAKSSRQSSWHRMQCLQYPSLNVYCEFLTPLQRPSKVTPWHLRSCSIKQKNHNKALNNKVDWHRSKYIRNLNIKVLPLNFFSRWGKFEASYTV